VKSLNSQALVVFANGERVLELVPGRLERLALPSGGGKTALGLFLASESRRCFSFPSKGNAFRVNTKTQYEFSGSIRPVYYLDGDLECDNLLELFHLEEPLRRLVEREGLRSCPNCDSRVEDYLAADWLQQLNPNAEGYVCVALQVELAPENALELFECIRAYGVLRMIFKGQLMRIPELESLRDVFESRTAIISLVFGALDSSGPEFSERLMGALKIAREAQILGSGDVTLSFVDKKSKREVTCLKANTDLRCGGCGAEFLVPPEKKFLGKTFPELCSTKVSEFYHSCGEISGSAFEEIIKIGLGDRRLSESLEGLSVATRIQLSVIQCLQLRVADSIIYIDGVVPEGLARLLDENNAVVAAYSESSFANESASISDFARLRSRRVLFQYLELARPLAELFASLPEARQSGISRTQLAKFLCPICRGSGVLSKHEEAVGLELEVCPECLGERVRRELSAIRYQGRNLSEILDLTIAEACRLFSRRPEIYALLERFRLPPLLDLRLGEFVAQIPSQKYLFLSKAKS